MAKTRPTNEPVTLSSMLDSFLGKAVDSGIPPVSVYRWWIHRIPRKFSRTAWPVRMQGTVLIVHARTAPHAAELDFRRTKLILSARKFVGENVVSDIRIRVGQFETVG